MVAPTTHGAEYKKKFDAIYPKLSKKYNLPLIPFLLDGVALDPSLNQQDGIHPNKEGTIVISKTLRKFIEKNKLISFFRGHHLSCTARIPLSTISFISAACFCKSSTTFGSSEVCKTPNSCIC
jgi:hypothetical protein